MMQPQIANCKTVVSRNNPAITQIAHCAKSAHFLVAKSLIINNKVRKKMDK